MRKIAKTIYCFKPIELTTSFSFNNECMALVNVITYYWRLIKCWQSHFIIFFSRLAVGIGIGIETKNNIEIFINARQGRPCFIGTNIRNSLSTCLQL